MRVLLGRHWSCNPAANGWCGRGFPVGAASLTVTIDWPYGTAPVQVTTSRLPAGTGALSSPPVLSSIVATPRAGKLTVSVPSVSDGDAISITAH